MIKRARTRSHVCLIAVTFVATAAFGKDVVDLGSIEFANSGVAAAQGPFYRGVLLLHSFEYVDAREEFQAAQAVDPDFALAYWGEAMTHNHPLWRQQDLEAARAALARLAPTPEERASKATTEREKGYLAAVETLFGEGSKVDRDEAYSEAMRELAQRYPEDLEARSFYAVSILGTTQGERDFSVYMRAGAVAEEVFAANPRHPGAAHYLIHSYDDPIHAPLGLRPARVYADIAPAASHAQHMISHIYVALGRWEDSVESNANAWRVSVERAQRKGLDADSQNYHALYWLMYSYLQLGRYNDARTQLDMMREFAAETRSGRAAWHYAAMRAAYIVETETKDLPASFDADDLRLSGAAKQYFADGFGALRREESDSAIAALTALNDRIEEHHPGALEKSADAILELADGTLADAVVMALSLEGLIALHQGRSEEAVEMLEQATAIEEERPLEYGPPSITKPSHELFGEVLLSLSRLQEAREQFELGLDRAPRRTRSLAGIASAAAAGGEVEVRAAACNELQSIRAAADPSVGLPAACS